MGGLLRRGPRGRPRRAALEVPPDPRRRHLDRRPRPGAARRRPRTAASWCATTGWPRPSPRRRSWPRAPWSSPRATPGGGEHAAQQCRGAGPHRWAGRPAEDGCDRRRAHQPALRPRVAVQHRAVGPAPRGAGAHLAQGLPQDPPGARRHRQRRHPGDAVGRDPGLVHDPRRVGRRRSPAARAGADERHRRGARADVAGLPGGRPPRRPADRRGVARRTPAPGVLRPAGAQRDRAVPSPPTGSRASPGSRRPRSTRSGSRVAFREAARQRQPGDHQRARAAVPDVPRRRRDGRDLPGPAAPRRASRCRSASPPTTAPSTTASAPTATRSRTSTSSASACARRSTSSSTARATAGCERRAAASAPRPEATE